MIVIFFSTLSLFPSPLIFIVKFIIIFYFSPWGDVVMGYMVVSTSAGKVEGNSLALSAEMRPSRRRFLYCALCIGRENSSARSGTWLLSVCIEVLYERRNMSWSLISTQLVDQSRLETQLRLNHYINSLSDLTSLGFPCVASVETAK